MDFLKPHKPMHGGPGSIFLVNMNPHADMPTMTATAAAMMAVICRMNRDSYAYMDLGWSCYSHARCGELSHSERQSAEHEEANYFFVFHCIILIVLR
jgi:hypothetical protein